MGLLVKAFKLSGQIFLSRVVEAMWPGFVAGPASVLSCSLVSFCASLILTSSVPSPMALLLSCVNTEVQRLCAGAL